MTFVFFFVNDELRITTDLINGFLYGYRDLGCYVFTREEASVTTKKENNLLMTEIKAGEVSFVLGHRAKRFIISNFAFNKNF